MDSLGDVVFLNEVLKRLAQAGEEKVKIKNERDALEREVGVFPFMLGLDLYVSRGTNFAKESMGNRVQRSSKTMSRPNHRERLT